MNHVVHYVQACPVCGRTLRVRVSLLGKRVYCQHCGGGFRATDPATRVVSNGADGLPSDRLAIDGVAPGAGGDDLLRRVETVLQRAGGVVTPRESTLG
ncbi:MAG: hypothetical protein ACKOCW_06430 [Planctomycetaceae bacterium]